jgi:hypothetical protein
VDFHIRPGALPASAWTERASEICAVCAGSVNSDEHEDLADIHDEDCMGCPVCEIPIRLFRELSDGRVLGVAMHWNCFQSIFLVKP